MTATGFLNLQKYTDQIMQEATREGATQDDGRTQRKTVEYGYSFFKLEKGKRDYTPPPKFLQELGKKACQVLGHEAPAAFTNIILSVYNSGYHLEPHVDVDQTTGYDFWFSERVYGVVVQPDTTGHLYLAEYEGDGPVPLDLQHTYDLDEQVGTVFCLQGEQRHGPCYHGVTNISDHRISLTFRTVEFADA